MVFLYYPNYQVAYILVHSKGLVLPCEILAQEELYDNYPNCSEI